ncbi:MAG TPA: DedA family protein [Candidatus Competibacteraceae bacterium]|nr:DedA family protein [Candidatus Competibacteraceae bacterium]
MALKYWIEHYGYWAILLGTFLEGETILLLGGFAAHRGYLELPWVVFCAFVGSFAGDQLYYYVGRRCGWDWLARHPRSKPQVERIQRLLDRYHAPLIVGIRFLYGLRIAGPFVFGMARVPARTYLWLNALGAAIWALSFGAIGFFVGEALQRMLGDIKEIELAVLGGFVLLSAALWLSRRLRRRRAAG